MSRDVVQRLANILQRGINCWDTVLVQAKHKHPQPRYVDIKYIQTLGGIKTPQTHTHTNTQEGGKHCTQIHKWSLTVSLEDLKRRLDKAAGFNSVLIKRYRRGNRWEKLWLGGGGGRKVGGNTVEWKTSYESRGWWAPPALSTELESRWGSACNPVSSEMLPQLSLHCLLPLHPVTMEFTGWSEPGGAVWTVGAWVALRRINISVVRFNTLQLTSKENLCADLESHTYGWRCKVFWEVQMKAGYMKAICLYIQRELWFTVPTLCMCIYTHICALLHYTVVKHWTNMFQPFLGTC